MRQNPARANWGTQWLACLHQKCQYLRLFWPNHKNSFFSQVRNWKNLRFLSNDAIVKGIQPLSLSTEVTHFTFFFVPKVIFLGLLKHKSSCRCYSSGAMKEEEKLRLRPNPLSTANPLSQVSFHWVNDFMVRGSKGQVEPQDMFEVLDQNRSDRLFRELEAKWKSESRWGTKGQCVKGWDQCAIANAPLEIDYPIVC